MKSLLLAVALAVGSVALVGCEMTDAQKEAAAFRKMCDKNPEMQECKDWKEQNAGG